MTMPIECDYGDPSCQGGFPQQTHGGINGYPGEFYYPPFTGYSPNGNGDYDPVTNASSNNPSSSLVKNPQNYSNGLIPASNTDFLMMIKQFISRQPLLAFGGAALIVYLIAKK